MESNAILAPGQRAFVERSLPGFSGALTEVTLAGSAASQRTFLRLRTTGDQRSFILVLWDSRDEDWERFLSIPRELAGRLPFLPKIHAADASLGLIIEEDFGELTLRREIERDAPARNRAYRRVLDALALWQSIEPGASPTIAGRSMDYAAFRWESDYFARHCVVELCGCGALLDEAWEAEAGRLAEAAAGLPRTFLHRDFQSENILLFNGEIRFVDFQGARLGPPAYDVASLLFDPYITALDGDAVRDLYEYYSGRGSTASGDRRDFYRCAAQRLMQALGAYGNLTVNKGKPRYRRYVGVALRRLNAVMDLLPEYGAIARVAAACAEAVGA